MRSGADRCWVLIADDDRLSLLLATEMLKYFGCEVEAVSDGRIAVEAAIRRPFDLILMDVRMPIMDGLAATRAIRLSEMSSDRHLPIVALTAGGTPEEVAACRDAGMDDALIKPFPLAAIATVLEAWCPPKQRIGHSDE